MTIAAFTIRITRPFAITPTIVPPTRNDALTNTRVQLNLAEGRYTEGVGSIIELADAQVAYSNARAQVVQAHFNLSNSRALLATALGIR